MKVCSALQNRCCMLQAMFDFNNVKLSRFWNFVRESENRLENSLDERSCPELDNTDMQRLTYLAENEI